MDNVINIVNDRVILDIYVINLCTKVLDLCYLSIKRLMRGLIMERYYGVKYLSQLADFV